MSNNINIKNDVFEITRHEGVGYVKYYCEYDNSVFNLNESHFPSAGEGGDCMVIYRFTILNKIKSNIIFISDYGDCKYINTFIYDPKVDYLLKA